MSEIKGIWMHYVWIIESTKLLCEILIAIGSMASLRFLSLMKLYAQGLGSKLKCKV